MVKDRLAQAITDAKRDGWWKYVRQGPGQAADEHAMLNGCTIDLAAAKRWENIFEKGLAKPEGGTFSLIDWQRDQVIIPLFGWTRGNGSRRYRKGAIWTAKKNGKTTMIAGLVNGFLYESPVNSRIYATAFTREQAKTLYDQTAAITRNSRLGKVFDIRESQYLIKYPKKHSYFKVVPGEAGAHGLDGLIAQMAIIDEIHEHKTRAVYDRLNYSTKACENGLVLSISTVGKEDHTLIWWEQYRYTQRILHGEIFDDSFFTVLYQADPGCITDSELRRDPAQWKLANPSLGEILSEDVIRDELTEAENEPHKMYNWLQRTLNIPTGVMTEVVKMEAWKECGQHEVPDLDGRACFGGLDLASTEDLTAFVLYFPPRYEGEKGWLLSRFWCPEDTMVKRANASMTHYQEWQRKGELRITPGEVVSYQQVLEDIQADLEAYDVQSIGYDPHNAEAMAQKLEPDVDVVKISQSIRAMTIGTKAFLNAVASKAFCHDGNGVMTWCCGNAALEEAAQGEYMKFSKKASSDKIDGAVAASMAFHLAQVTELTQPSIYDEPGGLFL